MNKQEFSSAMNARGCVSDGDNFCGTYNDYPFTVMHTAGSVGGKTTFTLSILFGQVVPGKLYSQLRKQLKGTANVQKYPYNNVNTALYLTVTVPASVDFNMAFDKVIAEVVTAAQAFQLTAPMHCPICNQANCDSLGYHNFYQPVHYNCVKQKSDEQYQKAVKNQTEGNYALGILGAVLGAIVGAIPTIISIAALNIISAWLTMLIPLASYYGYKLFKGKLTKATPWLVILITLITAPLAYWISIAFSVQGDLGYFMSLGELIQWIISMPDVFVQDLVITLIFTVLGIVGVFGIIRRNSTHDMQSASFNMASLRPIAGQNNPAQPMAPAPATQMQPEPVQAQAVPQVDASSTEGGNR